MTVEVPEGMENTDCAESLEFDQNADWIFEYLINPLSEPFYFSNG